MPKRRDTADRVDRALEVRLTLRLSNRTVRLMFGAAGAGALALAAQASAAVFSR